jgi:hypothetical protein
MENSPTLWLEWGDTTTASQLQFLEILPLRTVGVGQLVAAVKSPSFLKPTWEGTYDSCKCDDIGNDRLSSRLVVCNWSQEFSTRSDTPRLYRGSQKWVFEQLGGWEDPHLTHPPSQAQGRWAEFWILKSREIFSPFKSLSLFLSLVLSTLFLLVTSRANLLSKPYPGSLVSQPILSGLIEISSCYNQGLKLIKPENFCTTWKPQANRSEHFLLFSTPLYNEMLCFHESALIQTSRLYDRTLHPSLCLQAGLNLTHPRLKGVSFRPCFKVFWVLSFF